MNVNDRRVESPRRGNVLVMTAVLMPVLAGFTAIAVDTAVIATARSQLQTTADSAALAAAQRLASRRAGGATVGLTQVREAHGLGIEFAGRNRILGSSGVLLQNNLNLNTGREDIVAGYLTRPFDPTQALKTDSAALPYSNAVMIRAARTAGRGGEVPGYFSRIWNKAGTEVRVRSAAAAVNVSGFRWIDSMTTANVFPITLDRNTYLEMLARSTEDKYTYDKSSNTIRNGSDGVHESTLFPVSRGPGNWGTVNIGVMNNSTSNLGAQIRHGVTPAQLATYPNGVLQPDPATGVITLTGDPGISAGIKDDLQWRTDSGIPGLLPIFDPALSGGVGNNMKYGIVAFAPVRLLKVNFQGKRKYVIIQPAGMPIDATAVWGGIRDGPADPQHVKLVLIR